MGMVFWQTIILTVDHFNSQSIQKLIISTVDHCPKLIVVYTLTFFVYKLSLISLHSFKCLQERLYFFFFVLFFQKTMDLAENK
jgi:hypothetical protein